jgi:hypothetical protein
MLEFNAKHDSMFFLTGRKRMIEVRIVFCGMKQDVGNKNGTHAHAEARDNRKCTAE